VRKRIGKLWCGEGSELLVEQIELAVEACSDQPVLGLTTPPVPRLRGRVGDKGFLLQGLNGADPIQERSALLRNRAAPGQEPCECRVSDHLEQGGFQEGFDGFGAAGEPAAAAKLAVSAQRLDRPGLGLPVVGVHPHAAVPANQEPAP
jgi:hypothetical protein